HYDFSPWDLKKSTAVAYFLRKAVTGPVGDPHFRDAPTDASDVPGISLFHAANAGDDACGGIGVPETVQPGRKLLRLTYLDHDRRNVVYGLQTVKRENGCAVSGIGGLPAGELACFEPSNETIDFHAE